MIYTRTVQDRGQVTLPKELRERMGIKVGDEVAFIELDGAYYIKKIDHNMLRDFLMIDHKETYKVEERKE